MYPPSPCDRPPRAVDDAPRDHLSRPAITTTSDLTSSLGIRAVLMLADHAVVAEGKLYVAGGGWSVRGPQPTASAIALKLDVPWHMTNQKISYVIALVHQDGRPVTHPGSPADVPVTLTGDFEVGRPAGLVPGTPIDVSLALGCPLLQLQPGGRCSWDFSVNGETRDEWHVPFSVRTT